MKKGNSYNYWQIEAFANSEKFEITELGGPTIGRGFIVLDHPDKECCISFILDGYIPALGNQYTCIYSDLK